MARLRRVKRTAECYLTCRNHLRVTNDLTGVMLHVACFAVKKCGLFSDVHAVLPSAVSQDVTLIVD